MAITLNSPPNPPALKINKVEEEAVKEEVVATTTEAPLKELSEEMRSEEIKTAISNIFAASMGKEAAAKEAFKSASKEATENQVVKAGKAFMDEKKNMLGLN